MRAGWIRKINRQERQHRRDDLRVDTGLFRLRRVRRPGVLHRPRPAYGDDAKLEDPPADDAVVAQHDAELVGVRQLRKQDPDAPGLSEVRLLSREASF